MYSSKRLQNGVSSKFLKLCLLIWQRYWLSVSVYSITSPYFVTLGAAGVRSSSSEQEMKNDIVRLDFNSNSMDLLVVKKQEQKHANKVNEM